MKKIILMMVMLLCSVVVMAETFNIHKHNTLIDTEHYYNQYAFELRHCDKILSSTADGYAKEDVSWYWNLPIPITPAECQASRWRIASGEVAIGLIHGHWDNETVESLIDEDDLPVRERISNTTAHVLIFADEVGRCFAKRARVFFRFPIHGHELVGWSRQCMTELLPIPPPDPATNSTARSGE